MRTFFIVLLGLIFLTMFCCTDSNIPSESEVIQCLNISLNEPLVGGVRIINLKKINGRKYRENGTEAYLIDFQAEVEVLKDCWYAINEKSPGLGIVPYEVFANKYAYNFNRGKRGQIIKFNSILGLLKTERGWVPSKRVHTSF